MPDESSPVAPESAPAIPRFDEGRFDEGPAVSPFDPGSSLVPVVGAGTISGRGPAIAAELWPEAPYALFTLVPILSVAAALAVHRYRIRRAEALCGTQYLFAELCRQHSIDAAGQRLLKRIAAGAKLSQPAEMFVLPSRFDAATAAAARLRPGQGEKLLRIREQLFGVDTE